jgi:FdhD protein
MKTSVAPSLIQFVTGTHIESRSDLLAVEEPLEIRLVFGPAAKRVQENVTVTMRTPGHDAELTLGFLFTERIIESYEQVESIHFDNDDENIVSVELKPEIGVDLKKLQRNFYTTSSCGVCGKSSIDSVHVNPKAELKRSIKVSSGLIQELTEKLSRHQTVFGFTGGLHAVSLFSNTGEILMTYEDVGRHNAFDKVIGACLMKNMLPASNNILLVSGRASFELVQKAVVSGIQIMAAVSAPSSLAVELAKKFNLTLLGFVRNGRFNIYSGEERISV